jgi:hypothetical protein
MFQRIAMFRGINMDEAVAEAVPLDTKETLRQAVRLAIEADNVPQPKRGRK